HHGAPDGTCSAAHSLPRSSTYAHGCYRPPALRPGRGPRTPPATARGRRPHQLRASDHALDTRYRRRWAHSPRGPLALTSPGPPSRPYQRLAQALAHAGRGPDAYPGAEGDGLGASGGATRRSATTATPATWIALSINRPADYSCFG